MGPTPLWNLLVQSRQIILSNHPVDLGIQWILYEDGHHLYLASRSRDDIFFSGTPTQIGSLGCGDPGHGPVYRVAQAAPY